jgi:hypothetical protein
MKLLTDALNSKLKAELYEAQKQAVRQQQKSKPVVQKSKPVVQKSKRKWSKNVKRLANIRTPEAPYGLRLDGTPRKPTGPNKNKEKA